MTPEEIKAVFYKVKVADRIIEMLEDQDDELLWDLLVNLIQYVRSETSGRLHSFEAHLMFWLITEASDDTVDEVFSFIYGLNLDELD